MRIGEKIKKLREFRNFTQDYMAKSLEMTQAGYSRIERDEVDLNVTRLQQIAKLLNVEMGEVLGFNTQNLSFNTNANDNCIVYQNQTQNLLESERKQYEVRLAEKDKEIERLHTLLKESLTK